MSCKVLTNSQEDINLLAESLFYQYNTSEELYLKGTNKKVPYKMFLKFEELNKQEKTKWVMFAVTMLSQYIVISKTGGD